MTRSLRAADGLTYPTGGGLHWLIVDDNNDPEATYPDYAGEAPTLALALQYAASDELLEACEGAHAALSFFMAGSEGPDITLDLIGQLAAAIAKARGQS